MARIVSFALCVLAGCGAAAPAPSSDEPRTHQDEPEEREPAVASERAADPDAALASMLVRVCTEGCASASDLVRIWRDGAGIARQIEISTSGPNCPPYGRRHLYDVSDGSSTDFLDFATDDVARNSLAIRLIQGLEPETERECASVLPAVP